MAALLGPLVAAAGNMAGGYVGSLLMGDTSYPKGGGIEGLTSADAGKNSGVTPAIQIDPTTALNYFKDAAGQFSGQAKAGLDYYNQAIEKAYGQLETGYGAANKTLTPLSVAGRNATNQFLKTLGIDAISPTYSVADQVGALGGNYTSLANQIAEAEGIKDPGERATAKQNILQGLQNTTTSQIDQYNQSKQQQLAALGAAPTLEQALAQTREWDAAPEEYAPQIQEMQKSLLSMSKNRQINLGDAASRADAWADAYLPIMQADYQNKVNQINQSTQGQIDQLNKSIGGITTDYTRNYNQNADYFGYGADEVRQQMNVIPGFSKAMERVNAYDPDSIKRQAPLTTNELKRTPGYQFMYDQGNEAVMRAATAGGLLGSGNTLAAADKFSQGLAEQVYQYENNFREGQYQFDRQNAMQDYATNQSIVSGDYSNYLTSLQNAANMGNSATGQIAANQVGLGTNLAQLTQSSGQAGMQTYQNIGQALYNAYTNMGNTWNTDTLKNMDAQNAMLMQSNQLSTQAGIAANQQATSNGYLQLNQLNTLNGLANNQGYANSVGRLNNYTLG